MELHCEPEILQNMILLTIETASLLQYMSPTVAWVLRITVPPLDQNTSHQEMYTTPQ